MKGNEYFEVRQGPSPECPDQLKVWYVSTMEPIIKRSKNRVEYYENYCNLYKIKIEDSWKVNLRKEITYNNKFL